MARESDLWNISGGANSEVGLARIQLGDSNAEECNKCTADKQKEKDKKQAAKAKKERNDLENELEKAEKVNTESKQDTFGSFRPAVL